MADSPYCHCVIDVLLCMGIGHRTNLSNIGKHSNIQPRCGSGYHIMCEDCLALYLSEQVHHCHHGRDNVGEMHIVGP